MLLCSIFKNISCSIEKVRSQQRFRLKCNTLREGLQSKLYHILSFEAWKNMEKNLLPQCICNFRHTLKIVQQLWNMILIITAKWFWKEITILNKLRAFLKISHKCSGPWVTSELYKARIKINMGQEHGRQLHWAVTFVLISCKLFHNQMFICPTDSTVLLIQLM